jgi:hypothetical protein
MTELTTAWMFGCVCGFFMGVTVAGRRRLTYRELMRDRDPDWRRSFNHENTNRPTGKPPLRFRRSGDGYSNGPTTPKPDIIAKPQFPPPQIIREDLLPIAAELDNNPQPY